MPRTAGPHAAVVLLPGSGGWRPAYAALARQFAESGFVTLALDYQAETGRPSPGSDARRLAWPRWQQTVRQATVYLQRLPAVAGRKVGLVGFSLGAYLAVSVAGSTPAVGAVVDFFGGGGGGPDSLAQEVDHFPPLLILHGEVDDTVPVSNAYALRDAVVARGGDVEMHLYSGLGHGFNSPGTPAYSAEAAADGWRRTADFLRRRLGR